MEIRTITNLSTVKASENRTITGTAVVFNQASQELGDFVEYVSPRAFDDVDLSDIVLLWNHENGQVLARTSADNLKLEINENGLSFTATLPETQRANDVLTDISVGNVRGCSFGFTIDKDDWKVNEDGTYSHFINKIDRLYEISLTPFPAYKQTDVELAQRSLDKFKKELAEQKARAEKVTEIRNWLANQADKYKSIED